MGQVKIEGALTAGPASANSGFPSAIMNLALRLRDGLQKSYDNASGVLSQAVNSPSPAWLVLAVPSVPRGTFLYIQSDNAVLLRLTNDDTLGGNVVVTVPLHGLMIWEFPDDRFLKLLEVQGSATFEYFVSGPAS